MLTRICLAGGVLFCVATAWAAGKIGDQQPDTDVAVALRAESQSKGQAFDRRAALLGNRDKQQQPEAWWQSGYIQVGEKWLPFEEAAGIPPELRQQYEGKRAAALPTAAEQLQLADWCREQGSGDKERTHLIRALASGRAKEPAKILNRLGYRPIGPWWFTDAELKASATEMQATLKEWKRLEPKLEKLAVRLEGNVKQRQKAMEELRAVTTLPAIPVLEQTLALRCEPTAAAVVQVFSDMDSYRSSQALARLAILSNWQSIRDAATEELKQRPLEEFVPMTLEMMSLPIETKSATESVESRLRQADIFYPQWRFVFAREGHSSIQVSLLSVTTAGAAPINFRGPASNQQLYTAENTARAAADVVHQRAEMADFLNDLAAEINRRASALLTVVTESPLRDDPAAWWHWWDRDIVDSELGKDVVIVSEESLQVAPPPVPVPLPNGGCNHPGCLAAGTPVWTENGFVAIEKIEIGDRVLSKSVESGELAYKPVLRTTRREGAALAKITVDRDEFEASPGHNFWISGRGWMRSNQLETGMPAHTVTGSAALAVEDTGRKADVFNLVVADYHTYFVGKSMVLGHDVIQPAPTDAVVPGLTPALAK